MKRKIFTLLFVLLINSVFAQKIVFENLGLALSVKDSLKIDQIIHYELDFFEQFAIIDSVHIKLHLFKDKETYIDFLKKNGYREVEMLSGGLYLEKTKDILVPKTDKYLNVIFHEISHYIYQIALKKSPGWLNEGLSKYFENTKLKKNKWIHEMNDSDARYVKSMLLMKEIDLKKVMSIKGKDIARKSLTNEGFVHKVGYCIVYLLNDKYSEVFKQIVFKINNGVNSHDAIDTTFPGGFNKFEYVFDEYYK